MSAKKKAPKFTVNEFGYRVLGEAPKVEKAKKALDRQAAAREIRDLLFGSGIPYAKRQRIAELLDLLVPEEDSDG
jgi:hypothetical protein